MKKIIVGILIITVISGFNNVALGEKIIPDEAIRLRVLANSNSNYDQKIKNKVKDNLQADMYDLLNKTKKISEARTIIEENMHHFNETVNKTLVAENYNLAYALDFGKHYFPSKDYKGITYKEGYYESVLVTLGEGKGDNWWCVLFPPLCLLEAEEASEVEYKFFVTELIKKFFK